MSNVSYCNLIEWFVITVLLYNPKLGFLGFHSACTKWWGENDTVDFLGFLPNSHFISVFGASSFATLFFEVKKKRVFPFKIR